MHSPIPPQSQAPRWQITPEGEAEFDRWVREELLPSVRAARERELANPKPKRQAAPWWSEAWLDGDYQIVDGRPRHEWGD
jgi:hypothetical protein